MDSTRLDLFADEVFRAITALLPAHCLARLFLSGQRSVQRRLQRSVATLWFVEDWYRRVSFPSNFTALFPGLLELNVEPYDEKPRLRVDESLFRSLPPSLTSFKSRTSKSFLDFTCGGESSTPLSPDDLLARHPRLQHLEIAYYLPEEKIDRNLVKEHLTALSKLNLVTLDITEVPICASNLCLLPKSLKHLLVRFTTSSQPCDASVVFPELETLIVHQSSQYAPTNTRYLFTSHQTLKTIECHNGGDLTLETLSELSPRLTALVWHKTPEFFTPFAAALPRGLLRFVTVCLQIAPDALDHLPEGLQTLNLGTQAPTPVHDASRLPRALTRLIGHFEFEESQCKHLPRGLKTLPGIGQHWSFSSDEQLRYSELPPGLEELAIYYASPELLLALKCSKTLTKLMLCVTELTRSHALVLSRFTVLKHLSIPMRFFDSFVPHLSRLPLETLESISKDGSTYDSGYVNSHPSYSGQIAPNWVSYLPRTLKQLEVPYLHIEPFEFCDLPPKLQSLNTRVSGHIELQDLADLPRTLTDLRLAPSKPSILKVSFQTLVNTLPRSATSMSLSNIDIQLSDPPGSPEVILEPITTKCPGLVDLFFGGSHPYPDGTTWSISTEISKLASASLPAEARLQWPFFFR